MPLIESLNVTGPDRHERLGFVLTGELDPVGTRVLQLDFAMRADS